MIALTMFQPWALASEVDSVQTTGVALTGNDSLTITASGSINTSGTTNYTVRGINGNNRVIVYGDIITGIAGSSFLHGIRLYGSNNSTELYGAITTTAGDNSYGVYNVGSNNSTSITGTIRTEGINGDGVFNQGNTNTTEITGEISAANDGGDGVINLGNGNITTLTGAVFTGGDFGEGIYNEGDTNSTSISGSVNTTGWGAHGAYDFGINNVTTVSGTISTTGEDASGYRSEFGSNAATVSGLITTAGRWALGVYQKQNENITTLTGTIRTSGQEAHGIKADGSRNTINVSGSITTTGSQSYGIYFGTGPDGDGNSNIARITGGILSTGSNSRALLNEGDNNSFIISGTVSATGSQSYAIYSSFGERNRFSLGRGVRIVGGIGTENVGFADNNTLRFDVGSAMSYVYDTTGSWILEDLDGRAVVSGSAMAAGIGNAETADEVQFDRLSRLNQGIRLMPATAADSPRSSWATPYGFSSKRNARASDPTVTKYKSNAYGIVAGRPISRWGDKADLVIQLDQNDLDIDDADQTIKTTSARAGLVANQLAQLKGVDLSARALLGYNLYDSTRKVLVNTNTTTGLTTYDASFRSWELLIGGSAKRAFQLNANTQLNTQARLDLAYEAIGAYSEGGYFSWKNRKLLQSVAGLSTELERQHTPKLRGKVSLQLDRRNLISGKTTDYAINGTNVSFTGGDTTDTIATLGLGLTYKAKKNLTLTTDLSTSRSNNSLASKSAQLKVNYQF